MTGPQSDVESRRRKNSNAFDVVMPLRYIMELRGMLIYVRSARTIKE